tara:strand:- start:183 stop:371 length:189 start_codon:yes stop_codon:yes gene_type:complete
MLNLKTDKMNYEKQIQVSKQWVLNKYPNAKIEGIGSNGLVTGVWYKLLNNKVRTFTPLLNVL